MCLATFIAWYEDNLHCTTWPKQHSSVVWRSREGCNWQSTIVFKTILVMRLETLVNLARTDQFQGAQEQLSETDATNLLHGFVQIETRSPYRRCINVYNTVTLWNNETFSLEAELPYVTVYDNRASTIALPRPSIRLLPHTHTSTHHLLPACPGLGLWEWYRYNLLPEKSQAA
jgi:hypothetical protein